MQAESYPYCSLFVQRRFEFAKLYKHEDGSWHYRCGIDDFKNSPARYMNTPEGLYDVSLPQYVGESIDVYLKDGRPMLAGAFEGDYVFLPEKFANQTAYDRQLCLAGATWSLKEIAFFIKELHNNAKTLRRKNHDHFQHYRHSHGEAHGRCIRYPGCIHHRPARRLVGGS